jgi:hypothetical protein
MTQSSNNAGPEFSSSAVHYAVEQMAIITDDFRRTIAGQKLAELTVHDYHRPALIEDANDVDESDFPTAWQPAVKQYSYIDPFSEANPTHAFATTALIQGTQRVVSEVGASQDPQLAYLNLERAGGGRHDTVITKGLKSIDQASGLWIGGLPGAPFLRVVAKPYPDGAVINSDKHGNITVLPTSDALLSVVGGAKDGVAVRERAALQKSIIAHYMAGRDGDTLSIVSFGSGTSEPVVDIAIELMQSRKQDFTVNVAGVDVSIPSLNVAHAIANAKNAHLRPGQEVRFNGYSDRDGLTKNGIERALRRGEVDVVEAIGLLEYFPSENATNPHERTLYKMMMAGGEGRISAETFFKAVWDNMPEGSIFITGNMRDDSEQASFVTHGLGWPGIIQRSTADYMHLIKDSGIPADAVTVFLPKKGHSSGVNNIIAIQK